MNSRGVVYVAYGEQAREQVRLSAATMMRHNPGLPIRVIADAPVPRIGRAPSLRHIWFEDCDIGARWAKLHVDQLSPFDLTLYIDADTRIMADIQEPFKYLERGWELCICPTLYQGEEAHGHVNQEERDKTFQEVGTHIQVLQAGVFYFRKTESITQLFQAWRGEWTRWKDQDQAALVRALVHNPVKLLTLDRQYNDAQGRRVRHYCGFARRKGLKHSRAI